MNIVQFSLRTWGIAQLLFTGISLMLAGLSLLPVMLVPALAGGICSLLLFLLFMTAILQWTTSRSQALTLELVAIILSCFLPFYVFNWLDSGRWIWWDHHSRTYPCMVIAIVCGIAAALINSSELFLLQRRHLALISKRNRKQAAGY